MKTQQSIAYSLKNLKRRKLRSWLTILGIVIGIMTVIIIMSIGEGVKKQVSDELSQFGSDQMFVIPINIEESSITSFGSGRGPTSGKLFEKDFDVIDGIPGVKLVSKLVYGRASVGFKDKAITATVYGTDANYFEIWGSMYTIEEGRTFRGSESRVVVLGYDAAHEIFGKNDISIGSILLIGDKKFRVVGIFEKIGSTFSQADDSSIYVPYEDGRDLFTNQLAKDELSFISIIIDEGQDIDTIKSNIEERLASRHKVSLDSKDFSVVTASFVNETVGGLLNSLTTFLFLITLIASIVGGIGISNTMFMSVIERVREIGILKSVGATNSDVLKVFLIESGLLGIVGGVIGVILGILILLLIGNFGVPYLIRIELVLFALFFSFGIGVLSGFIPARRASGLNPIEAFRHE